MGGTWQIPSAVMAHKLVMIRVSRYGRFAHATVLSADIKGGHYETNDGTSAIVFHENASSVWYVSISSSGLMRFNGGSTSQPNVAVRGLL